MDGLALDGGIGVRFFDKRACAANDDLFQDVKEGDAAVLLPILCAVKQFVIFLGDSCLRSEAGRR